MLNETNKMQNQVWSSLCKNIGTMWTETADVKTVSKGTVRGRSYFWEWDRGSERNESTYFSFYTFQCVVLAFVAQPRPTLCDTMDCSPPGSSVCGILQARILGWITIPFSRGSSQPRDRTQVSCIFAGRFFTIWANREVNTHCNF